jgi:hypothetical protein
MIRTCDLCLRRAALYPLSYGRRATQSSGASKRLDNVKWAVLQSGGRISFIPKSS